MAQETYRLPRLVIAAPQGRSGKTTVTLGLCAAFKARGITVQPYKKGPDYIDPSWLSEAAGRACRSLDPFFYEQPGTLLQAFVSSAQTAALSLIEGNHGLFDSYEESGLGSTAAVARQLAAPILLVVNATRIGRSVAAIVHGCQTFEADTPIAGVVLNNVSQSRHETRLRQAIESYCGIPVLGAIPRDESLTIPDRHLGLVPRGEGETLLSAISACQGAVEQYLDLEQVLRIADSTAPLFVAAGAPASVQPVGAERPRMGVMRDRAFTFYYPENLEALEKAGAELLFIDALGDPSIPACDGLYIGGGFPEIFMDELSANTSMRQSIRQAVEDGLPVYAECGGMMYLSRRIHWGEKSAEMVGVLPFEIEMTGRPQGHGYVAAQVDRDNPFFAPGTILRGHEFHNSRIIGFEPIEEQALNTAYSLSRGNGLGHGRDGVVMKQVLASYTHLHAGGSASWAAGLVNRARRYRQSRQPAGSRP
jgi:cobyrinic acid a,c-diamide synthase